MRFFLIHRPRLKEIAYQRKIKNRIRTLARSYINIVEFGDSRLKAFLTLLNWQIQVELSILKEHVK